MKIGVISDTHGLLRPEVAPAFAGVDRILHLGDVGKIEILEALSHIAPVTAIRGNIDHTGPCSNLPETEVVEVEGTSIYLLHDIEKIDINPGAAGFGAVLYGHSHKPSIEHRKNVLYLNPGSSGPRRFHLPITVGLLHTAANGTLNAEIIELL